MENLVEFEVFTYRHEAEYHPAGGIGLLPGAAAGRLAGIGPSVEV